MPLFITDGVNWFSLTHFEDYKQQIISKHMVWEKI